MPKITENTVVEGGYVIGYVKANWIGSKCEFTICDVETWEGLSDKEADEVAMNALHESGMMEWGY